MQATKPINQANQPQSAPKRKTCGGNAGLTQAYDFRDAAHSEAMALKDEPCECLADRLARAKAMQSLNTVWFNAAERIRILRGKPLPGSLRPERKPTKKKQISSAPSEHPSSSLPTEGSSSDSMPTDHTK